MRNSHGSYIWYELLTADPAAAIDFYGKVVGWTAQGFEGHPDYQVLSADAVGVAGVMHNPMPTGPRWLGYIGVDDVDAAVAKLEKAGGTVHKPAWDIPGVGRAAFVADPQGCLFYVMRGTADTASAAFDPQAVGRCAWNELITPAQNAGEAFYIEQFGWKQDGMMPMPGDKEYRFLWHGGVMIGAMMEPMQAGTPTGWGYYFRVPKIDTAREAIEAHGGQVIFGPMEVPGGDWVLNGIDPQGALFGLVGAK